MKTASMPGQNKQQRKKGYSLLMTLLIGAVIMTLYAGAARWSASSAIVNDRNNTYSRTVSAAEAASELLLSYLARDFFNQSYDPGNLSAYEALAPASEWASGFRFGNSNSTPVTSSGSMLITNLNSQFEGLYGIGYNCRVKALATPVGTPYDMTAAVQQDVQLASIPIFQFAIFYSMDLEINPGPVMKITGKVHSNATLYTAPVTGLTYGDAVTAVGRILNQRHPDDPNQSAGVRPVYTGEHLDKVSSLTLPVGTNNSPTEVRNIVEVPPYSENPASPTGKERYYNRVDLIVTTTDSGTSVKTGLWGNFASIPGDISAGTNGIGTFSFLNTTNSFYDDRENKQTVVTELNVAALNKWMTNTTVGATLNNNLELRVGHQINSVYIDDQRIKSGKLTVVRVSNGKQLPSDGLTVATRLPLYVQGHFNAPVTTVGSTNTVNTKPASLVGDAITVLSESWSDANSTKVMSSRDAANTSVNAAFLAGIVQTTNSAGVKHYSGGVENFPRFLEDWDSRTLTYNGSMVVMFPSRFATNFWVDPGGTGYYNAPSRQWAFDVNFLDYRKLPPATPQVRKLVRGQWSVVSAR